MSCLESQRDRLNAEELRDRLNAMVPSDGFVEPMPGLRLTRIGNVVEDILGDTIPSVCFIAQGQKVVHLGGSQYRYDAHHYLLSTVELPVRGVVMEATADAPYLGIRLELEPAVIGAVMVEAGLVATHPVNEQSALSVNPITPDLLDAATRLVRYLENPSTMHFLVSQVRREIVLRLLLGPDGHRLRQLLVPGGQTQVIAKALEYLRANFNQPLRIDELARDLGMSSTRFHHHFKAVADMSPLQFQKQIRLQEARRLILEADCDAATAGYQVGYEDPSHFSRDYKRHFGYSPRQDIGRLRIELG